MQHGFDQVLGRRLAGWIAGAAGAGAASVVGVNGAQGSGKTTLALRLKDQLARQYGLRAAVLSLDDLYLPRAARERLAAEVHPLLRTRGVPGTHDVGLGLRLLEELTRPGAAAEPGATRIPVFVKALDDRAPEAQWRAVETPVDVVLFEGWCVGTPAQAEQELGEPVNALEALEDADGRWRRYVNRQLATAYAPLFARIDRLVFLQAPDFDSIFRWRMQQEQQNLEAARSAPGGAGVAAAPSAEQLRRFIQHYERLTRHALAVLPARADAVAELGPRHELLNLRFRSGGP